MHNFFELSYANYLVVPRTLLQSCSQEVQQRLADALEAVYQEEKKHMDGEHWPYGASIHVSLREDGKFVKDDLADYQRGRRRLWKEEA